MFYPVSPHCDTQPLIDVRNITLKNITSYGGLLGPGIIRGNETNPVVGVHFENVHLHGIWRLRGKNFITEHVIGSVVDSKPVPEFINLVPAETKAYEFDFMAVLSEEIAAFVTEFKYTLHEFKGNFHFRRMTDEE